MAKTGSVAIRLPRKYKKDEVVEVKTRIIHPNDNGRRKYRDEGYIAEFYVWKIEVHYGEDLMISMNSSSALSQNPYFTFSLKLTRAAPIRVDWFDTDGQKYTKTVDVEV